MPSKEEIDAQNLKRNPEGYYWDQYKKAKKDPQDFGSNAGFYKRTSQAFRKARERKQVKKRNAKQ